MQKPIDCDLLTGLLRTLAHGTGARPGKLDVVAAETSRRVSAMQSNLGRDARNSAGGSSEPQVPISMPATDDLLPGSCGPVLLRILIADGDGANQLVTKRLLRTVCKSHAGVEPEIIQVRGGCEAVAAVGKHSLDLVLMDINMPVANGVAAAAEIRRRCAPLLFFARILRRCEGAESTAIALRRHPPSTLPIIGLAASADSRPESRWSIFSQVALKPLTPADLESILRQHVKRLQQTSYKQTESQPVPSQLPQGAASVSETRTAQEPAACEGKSARPGGKELDSHSHASDVAARARGRNAVNVLVADDSAANQMAIKRIVRKSGRQLLSNDPNIRTVRDGAEALGAISKGRFDIVLMDVHMPNMNGIEAMRRIRKQ